jgi:hypothetical protein
MRSVTRAVVLAMLLAGPALADKPVPSGPVKAYTGPEGELIVLVEANDSKDMLVHFRNVGSELDGKTLLYRLEDHGDDGKTVYIDKKRGSKTYRSIMLTDKGRNSWEFINPVKTSKHFRIHYAESESQHIKVDEVLNAYKP